MSPGQDGLCMGEGCKWCVGGECAIALLARGMADARGGATDGNEAAEVDR